MLALIRTAARKRSLKQSDHDSYASGEAGNRTTRRHFIVGTGALTMVVAGPFSITRGAPGAATADLSQANNTEYSTMPLVRIDAVEGRSDAEVKILLDAAHRAIVRAFHVNERDRYQIYDAHPKSRFVVQDTGLGIQRTDKALIITVVSKQRPEILKRRLFQIMAEELSKSASVPSSDVMICIIENGGADWTFGNGEPQFLSGDLG